MIADSTWLKSAQRPRVRRWFALLLLTGGCAFAVLAPRRASGPFTPAPMVAYSAQAAAAHYRHGPVHDLATFLAKHDRNGDGKVGAEEVAAAQPGDVAAGLAGDVAAILNPTQALLALDALSPAVAAAQVRRFHARELSLLEKSPTPKEAYWAMDMQSRYLARRHRMVPAAALREIDDGGDRRIHGAEDLPPVIPFTDETVRAYEVPWPPGNVAVAEVEGRTRVFLTPFPDGNFTDTQIHELDLSSGQVHAYPPGQPEVQRSMKNTLGIEAHDGVLYAVDHGYYGTRDARLLGIDLATDAVVLDHPFATHLGQMPNDLCFVDTGGRTEIFVSDTAPGRSPSGLFNARSGILQVDVRRDGGRIVVLDQRRHLDGDPMVEDGGFSLYPDRDHPALTWIGRFGWGGIDGIAAHGGRVFFTRMQDPEIRAIPHDDLRPDRATVVDRFPFADGFSIDPAGNLWFGDVETSAIFAYSLASGEMVKALQDPRLHWLDEVNVHGDKAYVTASHLHEYMDRALPSARRRAVEAARPFFFYVVDLRGAYDVLGRLKEERAR